MSILIIIILIIILVNKNKKLDKILKENRELKKSLEYFTEKTKEKGEESKNIEYEEVKVTTDNLKQKNIRVEINKEKEEKNKKEQKNVLILITGAICIVLSAIIFLMSTWGITSNILKTIVLGLLTLVFFKMSKIAKVKYKLEKASQVFYYIGMAYIPICFLSIAIFELFGRYLSIYGDGKYIYFTITTLILAYVYYINRKDKYLLYGSILSQVLCVILFTLIFSNNIILIGINLLIYNLLLMILTKDAIFAKVYKFIPWAILIIPVLEYTKQLTSMTFLLVLLTANFLVLTLKNNNKIYYLYVFNICLMSIGIYIVSLYSNLLTLEVSQILSLVYIILIYTLENVVLLNSKNKNNIDSISFITIGVLAIFYILNLINNVIPLYIISIVQLGISIITYINIKQGNKKAFKYFIYIFSNLVLYLILEYLKVGKDILYYIPIITTLAIMKIERVNKNIIDEGSNVYLGISLVVSFICLYNNLDNLNVVVALILATIFIIENIRIKENDLNIIPLICVVPAIFNNEFNYIVKNIIMLFSVMGLTIITIKERKLSLYTIFSAIYILLTIDNIQNVYFREILFIIWSYINCYCIKDEKGKDFFKVLVYIGSLLLYNTIISDINIGSYTVINMLGYIVLSIALLRTILNKYLKNVNTIEYITYAILYISAISQYNNEFDGILFGALLILIVMISYLKKYGVLFLVSIFAILVNVFILTRKFWFSIPWWGYLLAIGIILISFAIRNEANDKKNVNAINALKKIKDKFEE